MVEDSPDSHWRRVQRLTIREIILICGGMMAVGVVGYTLSCALYCKKRDAPIRSASHAVAFGDIYNDGVRKTNSNDWLWLVSGWGEKEGGEEGKVTIANYGEKLSLTLPLAASLSTHSPFPPSPTSASSGTRLPQRPQCYTQRS